MRTRSSVAPPAIVKKRVSNRIGSSTSGRSPGQIICGGTAALVPGIAKSLLKRAVMSRIPMPSDRRYELRRVDGDPNRQAACDLRHVSGVLAPGAPLERHAGRRLRPDREMALRGAERRGD